MAGFSRLGQAGIERRLRAAITQNTATITQNESDIATNNTNVTTLSARQFSHCTSDTMVLIEDVETNAAPKIIPNFAVTITPSSANSKILLHASIMGEWNDEIYQKGVVIAKSIDFGPITYVRPPAPTNQSNRGRFIAQFHHVFSNNNHNSTMESCSFVFVDELDLGDGTVVTYAPCLVNTDNSPNATADFRLNSTLTINNNTPTYEVASSTFTVEDKGP